MPSAVRLREDYSAEALRTSARRSKNVNQSRRLLSLAAVRDGMDRGAAAKIGGMDRQTLRDWVHRFNAQNWLSNTVFENYEAIVNAACAAWRKFIAQPETITSIGMRDWAHVGQPL